MSYYDDQQQDPWYVPTSYPNLPEVPGTTAQPQDPTGAAEAGAGGGGGATAPVTPPGANESGQAGDYTSDIPGYGTDPSQRSPSAPQIPTNAGGEPGGYAGGPVYGDVMNRINTAPDEQSRAAARDELARSLQQELEADGHKITWGPNGQMMVDGRAYEIGGTPGASTPGRDERWIPANGSTIIGPDGKPVGPGYSQPVNWNREQFRDDWMADPAHHQSANDLATFLHDHPDEAAGVRLLPGKGDKAMLIGKDGLWGTADDEPMDLVYAQGEGGKGPSWTGAGGGNQGSYASSSTGRLAYNPSTGGWAPEDYGFENVDPNATNEIPGYDAIYRQIMGADPNEQATSELVRSVIDHPETLDDRTLETMKSRDAEEMALAQQAQDEELQHYGAGSGLADSPWLASQRADTAWNRRSGTISNNRSLDVMAAQSRGADRRSAADLGTQYGNYRTGKAQHAIQSAVETVLGKLGESRNRVQANNSWKEAAAKLGLSKQQLQLEYIRINNDYDIDMRKLSQQSEQFQQELAERIAQRKQQDDQFSANINLQGQEFQHRKDQDYWQRSRDTYAPRRGA